VRRFAAALVTELRVVQAATGGGRGGPVGVRLERAAAAPGASRRRYVLALGALARCADTLATVVPGPPAPRFAPVRSTLRAACTALAGAARTLAGAEGDRPPALARAQAREGVRLVVDALTTLTRALRRR
jgi:hypothetical protein